MKKTVSLMLTLALGMSLASPAFAAEASVDQQLSQVTSKVKATLGIGDEYTEFNGQTTNSGVFNFWDLNWNSESKSLMVEADENGKVMSYYLNMKDETLSNNRGIPSFPKTSRTAAQATAEAFVKKVLGSGESLKWDTEAESGTKSSTAQHTFSGKVLLNSLPSPITFSVTVQADSNQIIRYRRNDLYNGYVGGVPSAAPKAQKDAAAKLLKGSVKLKTEYVLDDQEKKNEKDNKLAVLRYIPDGKDTYYVDAQTGKLVNLTERYKEIEDEGSYLYKENAAASDAQAYGGGSGRGDSGEAEAAKLSSAEEAGISKLTGVLSQAELDKKLQGIAALGLSKQGITSFNYYVDEDDVYANIDYALKDDADKRNTSVTMDARTGEIKNLYGWVPYDENRKATVTEEKARQNAESFLKELWPDNFAELELYDTETELNSGLYTFTYSRKVNGYFFPENYYTVGIDVEDGTVRRLNWEFDREVKFQDAKGIISDADALDKWFGSYTATLGYMSVPVALNPNNSQHKYLIAEGQKYYNGLGLAYYLDREEDYNGVDAKTGALTLAPKYESEIIEYSDLDTTWAKPQMETLMEYGIGYPGGKLLPTQEVTQIDFISLLATTQSYYYKPEEKGAADDLYRYAYNMGIITSAQRNDNAKLTRIDAIKILLDYIGYGEVAKLENIFRCTFTDEASIPADSYGYAAIAQGMGLVSGDTDVKLDPTRTTTRVEAAMMVYNCMNR